MIEMVHFIPSLQRRHALLAAQSDHAPVLISGLSGTGKGAIARWIHRNSSRAAKPFFTVHHPEELNDMLFKAQGGTVLIHEISEWTLSNQISLLNFLRTRSIAHPENAEALLLANVRIMVTTSHALDKRALGGLFNAELLEKLNVFRIEMPPLSKRADEFEDITAGLLAEITRELKKQHLRTLSPEAWEALRSYDWPANIRELRNVLRMAAMHAQGDRIETRDLPEFGHDQLSFRATREQFEKLYLLELLKTFNGQIDPTCQAVRMSREAFLEKLNHFGIHPDGSSLNQ